MRVRSTPVWEHVSNCECDTKLPCALVMYTTHIGFKVLYATHCIVLKYLDGGLPFACVLCANARQPEMRSHEVLLGPVELLDAPNDRILHDGVEKNKTPRDIKKTKVTTKNRQTTHMTE